MTKKTLAWILFGTLLATTGAAGLVACSDDKTTPDAGGDPARPIDSGVDARGGGGDAGPGTGDGGPGGSDGATDAAVECGDPSRNPFVPYTSATGAYCPFQQTLADGGFAPPCSVGDHCCIYPQSANRSSTCNPSATACVDAGGGTTDWQCNEAADCPAGNVCCFVGEVVENTQCTGDNFARGPKGTFCRATQCGANETQLCHRVRPDAGDDAGDAGFDAAPYNTGCQAAHRCVAFSSRAINLGACLP